MTETRDPRPIARIVLPMQVEILPRGDAVIRYIGSAVHEIATPRGSRELVSPQDVAEALRRWVRREADPADSLWEIGRVAPSTFCRPEDQTTEMEQAALARYDAAKAAGLSDHGAREDGWPS